MRRRVSTQRTIGYVMQQQLGFLYYFLITLVVRLTVTSRWTKTDLNFGRMIRPNQTNRNVRLGDVMAKPS